jgi:tripartite-type tricarboxylate transporter receptor subunit TctC
MLVLLLPWTVLTGAESQDYPARPVKIIAGTPGNFSDVVARQVGRALSERWGKPVVIENRPGAGGTIGTAAAAQSAPDGYTLLVSDRTALAAAPSLNRNLAYDPLRDLAPITLLAASPMLLIAHPSVPAKDLREFIEYLRAERQPTNFASSGNATVTHLAAEVFRQVTGANVVPVHYKSSPPAMLGLLAGETKACFMLMSVALPHVKAGKVKAYAITSKNRFEGTPDVPTVAEYGFVEMEAEYWLALLAPTGTPRPVITKIHRDVVDYLRSAEMKQAMLGVGSQAVHSTPEELSEFIRSETARLKKVIESAGITSD